MADASTKPKDIHVDLLAIDMDTGVYWLDESEKQKPSLDPDKLAEIRQRHRDKWLAEQKARKQEKTFELETRARKKTVVELWPEEGESRKDFMDRCIIGLSKCVGPKKAPRICGTKWRKSEKKGKKKPEAKSFVARGLTDDEAVEACGATCVGCDGADAPFKAYDPSEPRDESGKWTEGGGSAGGGGGESHVAFHGTSDVILDQILRDGITVSADKTWGDEYYDADEGSVYVSEDQRIARNYAFARVNELREQGRKTGRAVVFELQIPKDEWDSFKSDENVETEPNYRTEKTIKAEWIKSYQYFKPGKVGGPKASAGKKVQVRADAVNAYMVITVDGEGEAENKAYDPNEPRDELGQWTDAGGGDDDDLGSMALGGEDRNKTPSTRKVDALRDEMGITEADVPLEQRQALDMYTMNSSTFNNTARLGRGKDSIETQSLDKLVSTYKTPRDMTVYRTVGWTRTKNILDHMGDAFSDAGFMSTTLDKSKIDKPGSYIEIQIPKGSHAFPVGSLSNYPEEAEILFPRDSRLQIISHEPRTENTERFVARLVS